MFYRLLIIKVIVVELIFPHYFLCVNVKGFLTLNDSSLKVFLT